MPAEIKIKSNKERILEIAALLPEEQKRSLAGVIKAMCAASVYAAAHYMQVLGLDADDVLLDEKDEEQERKMVRILEGCLDAALNERWREDISVPLSYLVGDAD